MPRAKAERVDGAKGRSYRVEGCEYPSVTTILSCIAKPALVAWSAKVERELVKEVSARLYEQCQGLQEPITAPQWLLRLEDMLGKEKAHTKELAKAGEIGSQVHALIEFTLRMELCEKVGPSPALESKAQFAYASWQKWRQSVKFRPILVEFTVVSKKHGYAGTADLLAEVNGVLTLVDWKTGKAVYKEAHLQNAAYREAVREMGLGDAKQGLILRLPKTEADPDFEAVPALPEEPCLKTFLTAKDLWTDMQEPELLAGRTAPNVIPNVNAAGPVKATLPEWQPVSDSK
jgi:hypothetical protein